MIIWFAAASSFVILLFLILGSRKDSLQDRLKGIGDEASAAGAPGPSAFSPAGQGLFSAKQQETRMDRLVARRVRQEKRRESLQDRMMRAGLYGRGAMGMFKLFRFVLLVVPAALGVIASQMGLVKLELGLILGLAAGLAGTLAPSFWLDHLKRSRQHRIRRALPDALDVMVVCLEGGLSLPASFSRVARELAPAHPMLALEFRIVDRHTQMGR
jgi:tight adherence protein C